MRGLGIDTSVSCGEREPHWLSIYGYPSSNSLFDLTSLTAVRQILSKLCDRPPALFFVRYYDSIGAHFRIRIRMQSDGLKWVNSKVVADDIITELAALSSANGGQYFKSLRQEPYHPEIDRYGGLNAMCVAEECFIDSSRWTLDYIHLAGCEYRNHVALGAVCAAAMVRVIQKDNHKRAELLASFCDSMIRTVIKRGCPSDDWLELCNTRWNAEKTSWRECLTLAEEAKAITWKGDGPLKSLTSNFARYWESIAACAQMEGYTNRKLENVGMSLVHMHQNRLGISNLDEILIANSIKNDLLERA